MSALVKRTRTGFQASDKLTFRMRQTLVQSTGADLRKGWPFPTKGALGQIKCACLLRSSY